MAKKNKTKEFLEEIRNTPIISHVCKKTGISRNTIYRWKKEIPGFERKLDLAMEDGEALVNDVAESKLIQGVNNGDFKQVRYWLDRRHPKFKTTKQPEERNKKHYQEDIIKLANEIYRKEFYIKGKEKIE